VKGGPSGRPRDVSWSGAQHVPGRLRIGGTGPFSDARVGRRGGGDTDNSSGPGHFLVPIRGLPAFLL